MVTFATPSPTRSLSGLVLGWAVILAMSCSSAVRADDARVAWNDCAGGTGMSSVSFACNTNAGQHTIVGSFKLDQPFESTGIWGYDASIYFGSHLFVGGSTLPDWWRVGVDDCRAGAITASIDFSTLPPSACEDPHYSSIGTAPFEIHSGVDHMHGDYTYGRLRIQAASQDPLLLEAGQEYLAFRLVVQHTKTQGADGCSGCCERLYVMVEEFDLQGLPSENDRHFQLNYSAIDWQGSGVGCGPTRAQPRSWGQIRSLYR